MIESDLRTAILAEPTLSAVGGVYPLALPQGASKPCVTYAFHDGMNPVIYNGTSDRARFTVTLKVFAETYAECRSITRALVSFLQGMSQALTTDTVIAATVHNVFNDYEDGLELYTNTIDLTLHAREA